MAYGLGALWGLQRLLHMVMAWRRHRLDLELGRQRLEALPTAEELVQTHATSELDPISGRLPDGAPSVGGTSVAETVTRLRPVLDARMIDDGDDVLSGAHGSTIGRSAFSSSVNFTLSRTRAGGLSPSRYSMLPGQASPLCRVKSLTAREVRASKTRYR